MSQSSSWGFVKREFDQAAEWNDVTFLGYITRYKIHIRVGEMSPCKTFLERDTPISSEILCPTVHQHPRFLQLYKCPTYLPQYYAN